MKINVIRRGEGVKFEITLYSWMLPAIITFMALAWALTKEKPQGQLGDGLETICYLVPALAVSCVSWIVYAMAT